MIRVFIADDHTIVRHGVRQLLATADDIQVAGEASDGRAVLTAIETAVGANPEALPFDVLVLDLSLPRINGTEVLRRVRQMAPRLAVVILSMYPEEQYALRLLHEGASAYLAKDRPADELLKAIRAAARGERWVSAELVAQERTAGQREELAPHGALSAREHQVFTLIIQGQSVSDIAAELNLSPSTVSNHVASIKSKLGVRTIGEIVSYAHRLGLVD